MLVTSWPLPNGTLLAPRLLSNATDAPYLGEAAILYVLTRLPEGNTAIKTGGSLPGFTVIVLALLLGAGLVLAVGAIWLLGRWLKRGGAKGIPSAPWKLGIWIIFLLIAFMLLFSGKALFAFAAFLVTQVVLRNQRQSAVPQEIRS